MFSLSFFSSFFLSRFSSCPASSSSSAARLLLLLLLFFLLPPPPLHSSSFTLVRRQRRVPRAFACVPSAVSGNRVALFLVCARQCSVALFVEFACRQHGGRCGGATIVVSKRGECYATTAAPSRCPERRVYQLLSSAAIPSKPPPPPPSSPLPPPRPSVPPLPPPSSSPSPPWPSLLPSPPPPFALLLFLRLLLS